MPRIRTLKPEHRQHRKVGPLSHVAYRLWVGMILEADDEGRLVCDPAHLRAVVFAYHPKITAAIIEAEIQGLASLGMIALYTVGETRYAAFPSWLDHQRIEYPTPSRLPDATGRQVAYPTEHEIQSDLYRQLTASREFCGHALLAVDRNVRIGSGYADLVLSTPTIRIVVEIKKTRADTGALRQIVRYCAGLAGGPAGGPVVGVLLAPGLGPKTGARALTAAGVALITYAPADGTCVLVVPSREIQACSGFSVMQVRVMSAESRAISQQGHIRIAVTPDPGKERIGKERNGVEVEDDTPLSEIAASLAPPTNGPDFSIPPSILHALARAPRLNAVALLHAPAWWQAEIRANPGVDLGRELLKAEAYLVAHPEKHYRKLSNFLHGWIGRADRET